MSLIEGENESPEGEFWSIEKLLDVRIRNGGREYLVEWTDYEEEYNSWEPEENLSPILIERFRKKGGFKSKRGRRKKGGVESKRGRRKQGGVKSKRVCKPVETSKETENSIPRIVDVEDEEFREDDEDYQEESREEDLQRRSSKETENSIPEIADVEDEEFREDDEDYQEESREEDLQRRSSKETTNSIPEIIDVEDEEFREDDKDYQEESREEDLQRRSSKETTNSIPEIIDVSSSSDEEFREDDEDYQEESREDDLENIEGGGLEENLEPDEIVALSVVNEELYFVMKWKGTDVASVVTAEEANTRYPQTVIRYYEQKNEWHSHNS